MRYGSSLRFPLAATICCWGAVGCATVAVATAPSKSAAKDTSQAAAAATDAFWETLHAGRYEGIGPTLERLDAAYLAHPNDPNTAAFIGFMHVWRVSERTRSPEVHASITDDIVLARRYFAEASRLAPDDARFRGFLAAMTLAEGNINGDKKLVRRGYFDLGDAVDAWPEFNLFTRGYVLSQLPFDDPQYAEAVEDQWRNLDVCAERHLDRNNPDMRPSFGKETHDGVKRACWNSWIAPHNYEGFFLNFGDMLVKAGDPVAARKLYAQAKFSKDFATWPYRDVLERRLARAEENVAVFRAATPHGEDAPMSVSSFACMGCHQQ